MPGRSSEVWFSDVWHVSSATSDNPFSTNSNSAARSSSLGCAFWVFEISAEVGFRGSGVKVEGCRIRAIARALSRATGNCLQRPGGMRLLTPGGPRIGQAGRGRGRESERESGRERRLHHRQELWDRRKQT